ncbi:unnamed protein product [Schistocephalus solidus]|uniref:Robl_LC7 domain-containing protein n=1 Tax=Schistocephalus solidus TaxID=70667 RepID=A0A183TN84_SCHSO|nr:unnamed protein product [Schistocephalus solidus]
MKCLAADRPDRQFYFHGVPIRSTMEDGPTHTYCALVQRLVSKCSQSLKELDPTDDLTFLRIRTAKNEIMVAPGTLSTVSVANLQHILRE